MDKFICVHETMRPITVLFITSGTLACSTHLRPSIGLKDKPTKPGSLQCATRPGTSLPRTTSPPANHPGFALALMAALIRGFASHWVYDTATWECE